jgi:protein subunit release factor B
MITEQKEKQLQKRMEALGIKDADLEENFVRGSGKGGQKINKTASCVHLIHKSSGLEVKCQKERSQALNRFFARRLLCDKIEEQREGVKSKKVQAQEKIRRQKRRRSRRSKAKMMDEKTLQGKKKASRKTIDPSSE